MSWDLAKRRRPPPGTPGYCFFAILVEIIGPPLHHLPAFRQVLGMIVSGPDAVPFAVGKLTFDHIRTKIVLIQDGAGRAAKAMPGGAGMIAHAIQGIEHRVLAHERGGIVLVWEKILPIAGDASPIPEERRSLAWTTARYAVPSSSCVRQEFATRPCPNQSPSIVPLAIRWCGRR